MRYQSFIVPVVCDIVGLVVVSRVVTLWVGSTIDSVKLTPVAFIIDISFVEIKSENKNVDVIEAMEDVDIVDVISITPEFSSNIISELLFELVGTGA